MQKECTERLKGGILWDDVHLHAHRIAVEGLLSLGILKGDVQEILDARTSAAFFPHGLGHHLGLDTHDTGGNPNPNDKDKLFRYLRLRGHVPAGAVVTVEPGVSSCLVSYYWEWPLTICVTPYPDLLLRLYHQAVSQRPRPQQVH